MHLQYTKYTKYNYKKKKVHKTVLQKIKECLIHAQQPLTVPSSTPATMHCWWGRCKWCNHCLCTTSSPCPYLPTLSPIDTHGRAGQTRAPPVSPVVWRTPQWCECPAACNILRLPCPVAISKSIAGSGHFQSTIGSNHWRGNATRTISETTWCREDFEPWGRARSVARRPA